MEISEVRVRRVGGTGKIKAYCTIIIGGDFAVHDVRVVEGTNGLFVSMPSRKTAEGQYKDIAHPVSTAARELIQSQVLAAFEQSEEVKAGA